MSLTGKQAKEFYVDRWVRNLGYLSKLNSSRKLKVNRKEYTSIKTGVDDFEKKLVGYGNDPIKESDLKRLNDLQDRVSRFISIHSGIKFVNREEQTKKFSGEELNKGGKRIKFILIEAPARYGKSYLLNKIEQDQRPNGWRTIKYAFREHPSTFNDVEGFLKKLLILIMQEKDKGRAKKEFSNEIYRQTEGESILDLVAQVVGELSDFEKLYFFIDDAEIAAPDVRSCIRSQLFPKIKSVVEENLKMEAFCIVAGRYVTATWLDDGEKHDNKLENEFIHRTEWVTEFLNPLRTRHILDALDRLLEKCNVPLKEIKREEFARIVNMVTSGHPESVVSALLFIGGQTRFAYGSSYWEDYGDTIFRNCVKPMCEVVLHEDNDVAEIFRSICTFRKYDREIISIIDDKYGEKAISVIQSQGLIHHDRRNSFSKDDRIRRILAFEKWSYFRKQAREQNKLALMYFEEILKKPSGKDVADLAYYRAVLTEYIFHSIMALVHENKKTKNKAEKIHDIFSKALAIYRKNWQKRFDVLIDGMQKTAVRVHTTYDSQKRSEWNREKNEIMELLQEDEEIVLQSIHVFKNEKKFYEMLYKVFE